MNEYQQSLKIQRDNYSVMKTAREEGREQERVEMAIKLKAKNMFVEEIAELTGLLVEEIEIL